MDIILASSNEHKLREVKELLKDFDINIITLKDLNYYKEIVEDGDSFLANALIKAETIYEKYHKPVLADDSGLEVDALNGEPGIYSARYSGKGTKENNSLLLQKMNGLTNRKAHYTCVLCFYESPENVNFFVGKVFGEIDVKETGTNGFGYDPLFLYNGKSFASITEDEKNKVSHRANAFYKLKDYLRLKNI